MKKWFLGLAGTIVAGVVVYWLTVGLPTQQPAPPPRDGKSQVESTAVMDIRVNAQPVVQPGGSASIQVEVLSGPAGPIADAQVRIDVGGGSLQRSGGLVSEGLTNPHGFFADTWTSPPDSAGIVYLVTVRVSKAGFKEVSRRIEIRVTS